MKKGAKLLAFALSAAIVVSGLGLAVPAQASSVDYITDSSADGYTLVTPEDIDDANEESKDTAVSASKLTASSLTAANAKARAAGISYDGDLVLGSDTEIVISSGAAGSISLDPTVFTDTDDISYTSSSGIFKVSGSKYSTSSSGSATLSVVRTEEEEVYDDEGNVSGTEEVQTTLATYTVKIVSVSLSSTSATTYHDKYYYYGATTTTIKLNSSYKFDESSDSTAFSYSCSNSGLTVSLSNNTLTIGGTGNGTYTVKVYINGKTLTFKVSMKLVSISQKAMLLAKTKKKTLTVKVGGTKVSASKVKWKSSNKKVATVSSKGVVKAKKSGNAIITATINGVKVGCAVSVTTKKKKKAINKAVKIASTSTYSQARRMQSGYYDCSSLVWRAYKNNGYRFGASSYAPTAAGIASYLNSKGKLDKKGFKKKNVVAMKIKAGDLFFRTGASNGRYLGIYHVEIFRGYTCLGIQSDGTAVISWRWANRVDGYGDPFGATALGKL